MACVLTAEVSPDSSELKYRRIAARLGNCIRSVAGIRAACPSGRLRGLFPGTVRKSVVVSVQFVWIGSDKDIALPRRLETDHRARGCCGNLFIGALTGRNTRIVRRKLLCGNRVGVG